MTAKVEELAKWLPAVKDIENAEDAERVANVWYSALEMSPWKSFGEAKFKEGMDDITLVSHVNSTVECALAVADIVAKHHGVKFDRQKLLIFGLLHDVDKAVMYVRNEAGEIVKSDVAKKIQHGVLTAMWARDAGFDLEMQHLILTHTPSQNIKTQVPEGILFGYIDLCDWELTCKFAHRD